MPSQTLIPYHRLSKDELDKHAEQLARTGVDVHPFASQRAMTAGYLTAMGYSAAAPAEDYGVSGRLAPSKRPQLSDALMRIRNGEATGLIVTKMDRLTRSSADFPALAASFKKRGWNLVSLDLGMDYATPTGNLMATVLVALAQWEAERIGERTRESLAARAAAGVVLGARAHRNPLLITDAAKCRIRELRSDHLSYRDIAAALDHEGISPPRGGRSWSHTTVATVLRQTTNG